MSDPIACYNGRVMPLSEVMVPALDRGFLFGDAVYEALRVYRGRAWLRRPHFDRLKGSLAKLRIEADADRCERRTLDLLERSGVSEGLIYLQVTRGAAPRTHAFPKGRVEPNELIWVAELPGDPYVGHRDSGIRVITHPDLRWARCDIKTVNLLGNVLAIQAAVEADAKEAVLINDADEVTEGSHTNVFGVAGGVLLTSPEGEHILPGCTRRFVLDLASALGIPHREAPMTRAELETIDELFLSGTTTEVLGIIDVDGRPVGDGKPGPVTRQLHAAYMARVDAWLAGAADA
jgi:D-alanine transaminase